MIDNLWHFAQDSEHFVVVNFISLLPACILTSLDGSVVGLIDIANKLFPKNSSTAAVCSWQLANDEFLVLI